MKPDVNTIVSNDWIPFTEEEQKTAERLEKEVLIRLGLWLQQ